ncbi:MAG: hypothetical protein JSW60_04905 [Thermoplasmatales archaeon]|nr:MAG: hypothetical protein JSW60_04905 [Thermoplasmatales archaeon]
MNITWTRAKEKLLRFMSLIQTICSNISMFSIGLKGIKAGDKALKNRGRFDILGFTGIKILVEQSDIYSNAYYFGSAIAVKGPYLY